MIWIEILFWYEYIKYVQWTNYIQWTKRLIENIHEVCIHIFNLLLHDTYWQNALKHIIYFYCAYTQSFIIIKKEETVDPMIDFDDSKILSIDDTNHVFQRWFLEFLGA